MFILWVLCEGVWYDEASGDLTYVEAYAKRNFKGYNIKIERVI